MKRIFALLLLGIILSLACQSINRLESQAAPTQQLQVPVTGGQAQPAASVHPSGRMWASMMYDPQAERVVLFGGGRLSDTWSLDLTSQQWSPLEVNNAPVLKRLGGVGAAYDQHAQRMIAFFYKGVGLPGETWALDLASGTWKNLRPANPPVSRRFTSLVYNSAADKTLLFGGVLSEDDSNPTNELWEYDYSANRWTEKHPSGSPAPVFFHQMVYDSIFDRMIVWGGKSDQAEPALWAFNDQVNAWAKLPYQDGPFLDYDGAMVFASALNKVFLYVGEQFWCYDFHQQSWEALDGTGGPGRQYGGSLAYDPNHQVLVYFGGANGPTSTWFYHLQTGKWTVVSGE